MRDLGQRRRFADPLGRSGPSPAPWSWPTRPPRLLVSGVARPPSRGGRPRPRPSSSGQGEPSSNDSPGGRNPASRPRERRAGTPVSRGEFGFKTGVTSEPQRDCSNRKFLHNRTRTTKPRTESHSMPVLPGQRRVHRQNAARQDQPPHQGDSRRPSWPRSKAATPPTASSAASARR